MKRLVYVFALVFCSLTSCNSLEEEPTSFLTTQQFYNTNDDAVAAVNAIYNGLNDGQNTLYNRLLQISTEMATDDYEAGPRAQNPFVRAISSLTHDPSNDRMQELWKETYDVINRANIAVDRITANSALTPTLASRLVNEAKFIRALMYFNLVRWFSEVPIVLHETTSLSKEALYVKQASEAEVYQQIIADLTAAEALPKPSEYGSADVGRATSGAAKSLLAKVYLTQKDWAKAAAKSKEVIDSGVYDLFADFADVFNVATKNGKEHIFSAQFKGLFNYNGNMLANTAAPSIVPGVSGGNSDAIHKQGGLYESFSANDKRKATTFISQLVSPANNQLYTFDPCLNKYFDPAVVGALLESSKNLPIIRFAEVWLMYAEALNEIGGPTDVAYAAVDRIRSRAGLETLKSSAPALTKDQFREALFQERRKELVYEYQRWFDLSRRGADYFVSTLKAAGKNAAAPKHIHFPIPQRELDLNPNLHQIDGWK